MVVRNQESRNGDCRLQRDVTSFVLDVFTLVDVLYHLNI